MWRSTRVLVVMGVMGLVACSSDDAPATVDQATFEAQRAAIVCDWAQGCCGEESFDHNACVANAKKSSLGNSSAMGYNAEAAAACLEAIKGSVSNCDGTSTSVPVCSSVYVGTRKTGEACSMDKECAPDPEGKSACSATDNAYGVCMATVHDAKGRCGKLPTSGDEMLYGVCGEDEACGMDIAGQYMCTPKPKEGSRCTGSSTYCGANLFCDTTTSTCTQTLPVGSACAIAGSCENGAYCDGQQGVCAPQLGEGEDCSVTGYSSCRYPLGCQSGVCTAGTGTSVTCYMGRSGY